MTQTDTPTRTWSAWTERTQTRSSADRDPLSVIELLVKQGHCDRRAAERAQRLALDKGIRPDKALIQLGLLTEHALAKGYAEALGIGVASLSDYPPRALFPEALSARFLLRTRAIPLGENADAVFVAVTDPLDLYVPAAIAAALGKPVQILVGIPIELDAALARLYTEPQTPAIRESDVTEVSEMDAERLTAASVDAPVIRLVNGILARAIETGASDIHLEPCADRLRVRYRYDGVLQEADEPPYQHSAAIISRVKIMARLDIAEKRLPQDGGIRFSNRGSDVDLRVSIVPSLHGETVALRVLDRSKVTLDFDHLGLPAPVIARFTQVLTQPNGIVLLTGPTGSGKTTTLYTGMLCLNSIDRNVVTVEDPIEYQLPGLNQIQVKPGIGLGFPALLRSILRQDPDVIMVGEVRDLETAQIAIQAALTGHLVLSTLHTNSAASTIPRLRDMGLEDYLLSAVLRGIVAQRLVRRICQACSSEADASPDIVARFQLDRRYAGRSLKLRQPVGCPVCRNTGYLGRLAIAEFLAPSSEIDRLIYGRADHKEIERTAVAEGMITMFDTGLDAALSGQTTIEEVVRSIRAVD